MSEEKRGPYIERCPHDRENPYAQISRDLIRDESLHPCTRWMLIYLLSMSGDWKISTKQIIAHCKKHYGCSRDKVYDWIKEAINAGYMMKEEWRERGLNRCRYLLSETPKFKKFLPDPVVADSVLADPTGTEHKKEHQESNKLDSFNKEEEPKALRPPINPNFPFITKISKEGFERLKSKYGENLVNEYMKRLNDYAEIKRKKFNEYTNHEKVLENWIKKDKKDNLGSIQDSKQRKNGITWQGKKIL